MLSQSATSGDALALIWESRTQWLVLPERFSRSTAFKQAGEASQERGWPVTSRKTGGGITPQGPGVLNLALSFTTEPGQSRAIRETYARICDPLIHAFQDIGIEAAATPVAGSFCDGDYNLAVYGRKLVGTAQRWRGNTCLIHALILTDIDLETAVDAVARFSADLGHDTEFRQDVHCRVVDFLSLPADATRITAKAIARVIDELGYNDASTLV